MSTIVDTELDQLLRGCLAAPGDLAPRMALADYLGEQGLHELDQTQLLASPHGRWLMPGRNQLIWAVHRRFGRQIGVTRASVDQIFGLLVIPDHLNLYAEFGVYCGLCRAQISLCLDIGPNETDRYKMAGYHWPDDWKEWEPGWRWWCSKCRALPRILQKGTE